MKKLLVSLALALSATLPLQAQFPVGSVAKFKFGTPTSTPPSGYTLITPSSTYSSGVGYGWSNPSGITITATDDATADPVKSSYISGNTTRVYTNANSVTYNCPTFVMDLPVGLYQIEIIQGRNTASTVSGAYVEGNMNRSITWATDNFGDTYAIEPSQLITIPAGQYADNIVAANPTGVGLAVVSAVAVWDGQLTVQVASNVSSGTTVGTTAGGTAVINAMIITRLPDNVATAVPHVRTIGDSTSATYPPYDMPLLAPIPEQTGWGGMLAPGTASLTAAQGAGTYMPFDGAYQFFTGDGQSGTDHHVICENYARGGKSARNFISEGFFNWMLTTLKPGDVCPIEWGFNEGGAGRRYCAATTADYGTYLTTYITAIKAFGGIPVLVSSHNNSSYKSVASTLSTQVIGGSTTPYIDLGGFWSTYGTGRTTGTGYGTVDGTHPTRCGATAMAQFVDLQMKTFSALSTINAYNVTLATTAAGVVPGAVATSMRVASQNASAVTLAWDMPTSTIYDPAQLILRYRLYSKAIGAADTTYTAVTANTVVQVANTYVTPDLTGPKLQLTIPFAGNATYAVDTLGVNGVGAKSAGVDVLAVTDSSTDIINAGIEKFQRYWAADFTVATYQAALAAVTAGKAALVSSIGLDTAAANITTTLAALTRRMTANETDDFQTAGNGQTSWGSGGTAPDIKNIVMESDANIYWNYTIAGDSSFPLAAAVTKTLSTTGTSKATLEFAWMPGNPDERNTADLRFSGTAGRFFNLKTAHIGHIGYYVGSTALSTMTDGFPTGSVDLGLVNNIWYLVRMDIDFAAHTLTLSLQPRDNPSAPITTVSNIAILSGLTNLTSFVIQGGRGLEDDNSTHDLSTTWATNLDDVNVLSTSTANASTTSLISDLTTANGYNSALYTTASYAALANAIAVGNGVVSSFFILQSDVDSARSLIATAEANLVLAGPPTAQAITGITTDTGSSSTDGITSDTTLVLNGTSQAGVTSVAVTRADLGVIGTTTTVDSSGNWTFDYTGTTLSDGVYTFTVVASNAQGAGNPSAPFVVTVDTAAPGAPVIATGSGMPIVFNGTAEAASKVVVSQAGPGIIGTATADGSGNWSFTYSASTSLVPNFYTFTATAADAAGNTGSASAAFQVDLSGPPAIPAITGISPDTGSSSTDGVTNSNQLTLNGTAQSGVITVTVTQAGAGVIGTAGPDGSGHWSLSSGTLADGTYTFTATATNAFATSGASSAFVVTVESVAPNAPVIAGGSSAPLALNGTAEASSKVVITQVGTGVIATATADGSGNWSYTSGSNLAVGSYTYTATATDLAGNTSGPSGTFTLITLPGAPTITGISPDSGSSSTDGITNTGAITLNGTAQAASTVTVTQAGTGAIGSTTADGSTGLWSFTLGSALSSGSYTFTATATNVTGTGPASSAFVVTVDTTASTVLSSNRQSPATTTTAPGSNVTYQVVFSEAVSGVTTAAFTLTGSGTDTGTIATVTAVNTSTYNVTVNNVQGAFGDTLRLDVNSSGTGITDIAGNALSGGFTGGQTYTLLLTGNGTWTNAVSGGLWSGAANWSGNVIASGTGNTANFSTLDLTADNTVHLDSAQTITRLVFADSATATGANWIVDNSGSAANTMTLAGTAPTITVNAMGTGNTTTISAVVAGSTAWSKLGLGTLVLSGANTISGAVTIGNTTATGTAVSGGIIRLDTGASLTASTLTIGPIGTLGGANAGVIVNGGTLVVTGATALDGGAGVIAAVPARNIIEVDSGTATFTGAFATSLETSTLKITGGTVTFSSTLNFFKSASNTTSDPTSHSIDFSGTAGGIIITGGNTTATGAVGLGRNAAGAAMIVSGGTTTLNSTLLLANGISTVNKGGGLRVTGGTLTVNNTAAGIVLISKGTSILNNFAVAEFAGGVSTVGRISIAGDTSQTTGIGQVYVDGGTLYIGAGGIATPAGTSAAPGTYLYSVKLGGSGFLPGLTVAGASNVTGVGGTQFTGDGILGAAANWSSAVNMVLGGNTTLQAADAGGTAHHITLSGVLSGVGGLVKTGGGTLTLSGNNTYTGTLVVNAGTLEKSGAGASAIILNNGGAVAPGTNGTVGTLGASSLTWNGGGQALFDLGTSSDQIALTGALTKGNAGTYGFVFTGGTSLANGTTITLATFGSTNFTAQDLSATGGPAGSFAVNAANLQFVVSAIGTIAGTVTDASSVAISGANVSVVVSGTTYSATSGSDGTYAIGSVPAGTGYTVTASATSYLNGTATNIAVTAGGTTSGVNFALNTSLGTITGTVMDNVSAAISGASVSVVVSGTTYSATSGSDGTYAITSVPAGTGYTVTASATGYLNGTATNVAVTAGGTTPGINFALSPAITTGTITGTVTNSASAAISGASVSVVVGGTTYSATSTVNGTYEIDSVPAGTGYTVTAGKTGYANGTATGVPVTAGQTTANVNITLTVSFASWAATHFTLAELADPSISGPAADPDHDGIPNLLEYAFNLNPKAADRSGLPVLGTTTVSGSQYLTLSYTQQTLSGDLTYAIQSSPDMAVWSAVTPVPVSAVDNGNGTQTVVMRDPVALDSSTHRFLRVQVSAP